MKETLYSLNEVPTLVKETIAPQMQKKHIWTFQGPLGAGKTTLIQEILKQRGITQQVVSPTYSYVQSYVTSAGEVFHHFDLYRLNNETEFFEMGFDQYLEGEGVWAFIEWPDRIPNYLAEKKVHKVLNSCTIGYVVSDFHQRVLKIF